jgi:uncharacterized OsmC-like protein
MTMQHVAAALQQMKDKLRDSPKVGPHDDAPATAHWQGDMRIVTSHANGTLMSTDMPAKLGGTGLHVTPGWLFRASVASCAATSIAMAAAASGIELQALEVRVASRSDIRGLLGMTDGEGQSVHAGPGDMQLQVRIAAPGVSPERLQAIVEGAVRCSPVPNAVETATSLRLLIDVA